MYEADRQTIENRVHGNFNQSIEQLHPQVKLRTNIKNTDNFLLSLKERHSRCTAASLTKMNIKCIVTELKSWVYY